MSTPAWARILLPILCLGCHALFYYGQTEPMWKLHVNATVDVWLNATDYLARRTIDTMGLDYDNNFVVDQARDVRTFTYYFAIHELWTAEKIQGTILPRLAAVLLIVFSGIWPHLKLMMLNLTWFIGRHPKRRTRTLQWLSALGKWSLADVLVVCVMVGVLHLDWIVDPAEIKEGVITDLPALIEIVKSLYTSEQLCDKLLHMECATQRRVTNIAKCKACHAVVSEGYYRPELAQSTASTILNGCTTSGGGLATMRVIGMRGIYAFCGAVILSIVLSLIVDVFDLKAKTVARTEEQDGRMAEFEQQRLIARRRQDVGSCNALSRDEATIDDSMGDGNIQEPLLSGESSTYSAGESLEIDLAGEDVGLPGRRPSSVNRLLGTPILAFSLLAILLTYYAVDAFTMERVLHGAGPQLLKEVLGVNFEKLYSFQSLMWTTGAAGGWDYLLMGTFGLFCVVGPILRAILLIVTVIFDCCRCTVIVPTLAMAVNYMGSFCAAEVFVIAVVMVQMLMPSITDTIIASPVCGKISDDGSCLQVQFNVIPASFSVVLFVTFFLMVLSAIVSGLVKRRKSTPEIRADALTNGRVNPTSTTRVRRVGLGVVGATTPLSRVMARNHDYERIRRIEENATEVGDGGIEELVFETNQV